AQRVADHQSLDGLLRDRVASGALPDVGPARPRRVAERSTIDQRVVEHHVRLPEPGDGAQGQELGITRSGPDQRDQPHAAHALPRAEYSSSRARRSSGRRASMGTPSSRHRARRRSAEAIHSARSSGSSRSGASRSSPASAGARPSVEIATVAPPFRTTPPRYALAASGSSTALTKMRRSRAAAATWRLTLGVAAATTNQQSSRSSGSDG